MQPTPDPSDTWQTQGQIAAHYGVRVSTINEHIHNLLLDGRITAAQVRSFKETRKEGERTVNRTMKKYDPAVVSAIGERVRTSPNHVARVRAKQAAASPGDSP